MINCTNSNRCHCRCHGDSSYMHIAACCCPHRMKNRAECLDCDTRAYFPVEVRAEGIAATGYPKRRKDLTPMGDNEYWVTERQLEQAIVLSPEIEKAKEYIREVGLQL